MDSISENKTAGDIGGGQPTASELFSSAQLVAGAAQSCFQGGADEVDKGKVAGAAADLLGAASHYGKLEEKGYGEYVEKAETYLDQYSSTGSAPAPAADKGTPPAPAPAKETPPEPADSGAGGTAEGIFKMAEGFVKGGGGSFFG